MKTWVLLALLFSVSASFVRAQGGIGVKPRTDLVMLGAMERDSVADLIFSEIIDLKRYAETDNRDSAALIVGWFGSKTDSMHWTRPVLQPVHDEGGYLADVLQKAKKLFSSMPESHRKYFAVFKDPKTPGGRKYLYQIEQSDGKHNRMVSWTFYGYGDKLMLGDFN